MQLYRIMAKQTILRERGTGAELYPHTLAELVRTAEGDSVEDVLGRHGAALAELGMLGGNYRVAGWNPENLAPEAVETHGSREWAEEWDFVLLDTGDFAEAGPEGVRPRGVLKRENLLRFEDGGFAPTVGITEEMRGACDVALYLNPDGTEQYCGAGEFDAAAFYEEHGMETALYDAEGNGVRVLRPWETTEQGLTIGLARRGRVYVLDNVVGKSGRQWRGIFGSPVTWDGIDVSRFPLARTALSPCPMATVGNKFVNFFFVYRAGDANCGGMTGFNGCVMFNEERTYPRRNDVSQISNMRWARAYNGAGETGLLPWPAAEGGWHALNAYTVSLESAWGTKYLHGATRFGSGISSNDACGSESTWRQNGGVRWRDAGEEVWKYQGWGSTPTGLYTEGNGSSRTYWSNMLNRTAPKEQCMESQMAYSYARECGIAENTEFEFYGNTYWYIDVAEATPGMMNARVYRLVRGVFNGYDADGVAKEVEVEAVLRMSLYGGMGMSGDIFCFWGGGAEAVGSPEVDKAKCGIDVYLEPDQTKWVWDETSTHTDGSAFVAEGRYMRVGHLINGGNSYARERMPHSPWRTVGGGGISTGECYYAWQICSWGSTIGSRVRIGLRFRGAAAYGVCSPRDFDAYYSVGYAYVYYCGSAQVLLKEEPQAP